MMIISDLGGILKQLSADRPIFHSEADFQHSFAWALHGRWPSARIRLEMPIRSLERSIHMDVFVMLDDIRFGIELKYKTRALTAWWQDEDYELRNQSAQDIGRYDFLLDVQRIEGLHSRGVIDHGASLLLTNDSAYWKSPRNAGTVDADFRLHDGRSIVGSLGWGRKASKGTTSGREATLFLGRSYQLDWEDYSEFQDGSYGRFRYLLLGHGN